MPRQYLTFDQLQAILNDLARLERQSPGLALLLQNRIRTFRQQNAQAINRLSEFAEKNIRQFVRHNLQDQPITEEVEGVQQYVFANELDRSLYLAELQKFMTQLTIIEL